MNPLPDRESVNTGDAQTLPPSPRPTGAPSTGLDNLTNPEASRASSLSIDEREVTQGLMEFDPQLAGLFTLGISLTKQMDTPGVPLLLAHLGRELSRGLIRAINGDDLSMPFDERDETAANEKNRQSIGGAFLLPPDHPLVKGWFRCVGIFSASCHFQSPGPDQDKLLAAFLLFTQMLKGRVSPFFPSHAELQKMIAAPVPTPGDLDRLKSLLIHPQQRNLFYSDLKQPGWLEPLLKAGFLQSAPGLRQQEDGKATPVPWFEARYLMQVASLHPDRVHEVLKGISASNQNPLVWQATLEIAILLPPSFAPTLIPIFKKGFLESPPWFIASQAIALIEHWANARQKAAFKLAVLLAYPVDQEPVASAEGDPTHMVKSGSRRNQSTWRFLDSHHMQKFVDKAIPALEQMDAFQTLKFLRERIQRVLVPDKTAELDYAKEGEDCHRWCESLEIADPNGDIRAPLVVAACKVARNLAKVDSESATKVWGILARSTHPVFERIRYLVLSEAGPFLQEHIDSVISDGRLLSPPFRFKEVAHLLRAQFHNAAPGARFLFKHALERGVAPMELDTWGRNVIKSGFFGEIEPQDISGSPSPALLHDLNTEWQRTRLRWFHASIPDELLALASSLGVVPSVPSREQQDLDEIGHHCSGASWRGYSSPTSSEELADLTPDEMVSFLLSWKPTEKMSSSPFEEGPTSQGLKQELAEFSKKCPDAGIRVGSLAIKGGVHPAYLEALFLGINKAPEEFPSRNVEQVLELISDAIVLKPNSLPAPEESNEDLAPIRDLKALNRAVLDLLRSICNKDVPKLELQERIWEIIRTAICSPLTWSDTWHSEEQLGFKDWLHRAINTLGGECVDTLFDVARWHHRMLTKEGEGAVSVLDANGIVWANLHPLLQDVIDRRDADSQGVSAVIGQELPFLWYLSPSWVESNLDALCLNGIKDPDSDPLWGAFLTTGRIYPDLFAALRPMYAKTADRYTQSNPNRPREDWSITRSMGEHVVGMMLFGHCAIGDSDHLLESVFESMSIDERGHCYWWASQGMSPEEPEVRAIFASAASALWEWRLRVIEAPPLTPEKSAEAGGLLWMLRTPEIASNDAIRLGLRNLALSKGENHTYGLFWDRLTEIAVADPLGSFDIAEILICRELEFGYSYIPFNEVSPILRAALKSGNHDLRLRAIAIVNKLGERGMMEFGDLLR